MDKYSVKLMSRALRDLDGIYDYIAHTLLEPGTALNLIGRIEEAKKTVIVVIVRYSPSEF